MGMTVCQSHWSLQNMNKETWSQNTRIKVCHDDRPSNRLVQYDDKKSIAVANIVEQEWLARYPRLYLITLDQ